jgi:predicted TIM-barrel fold metal-dependent hydrolase
VVEPLYGPAIYDEIMRCKDDLGLVGFTFHNGMQGVPIDSRLMCNLIERIAEAGMVPFVHALGNALETLVQVDSLAERFPDVDMVVLDVFHDMGQVYALQSVAERRPNLYFDLALIPGFEFMGLPRVKAIGADRFVYGTDMYSWPMMTKPLTPLLQDILDSDLSDDDKSLILSGNIRRVLTLA